MKSKILLEIHRLMFFFKYFYCFPHRDAYLNSFFFSTRRTFVLNFFDIFIFQFNRENLSLYFEYIRIVLRLKEPYRLREFWSSKSRVLFSEQKWTLKLELDLSHKWLLLYLVYQEKKFICSLNILQRSWQIVSGYIRNLRMWCLSI